MPCFLEEVFSIPISENGILCALSFAGVLLSKILCIPLAGYLRNKQLMSLTNLRKCFQTASMLISALCLLGISHYGNSVQVVTVLIILAMFGMGLQAGGETPQVSIIFFVFLARSSCTQDAYSAYANRGTDAGIKHAHLAQS